MSKKSDPGPLEPDNKALRPDELPASVNSLAAFCWVLESYGANKSRWPKDKRAAMERLLAQQPLAAVQLAQMQALEQVLSKAADFTPTNAAAEMPSIAVEQAALAGAESALVDQILRAAIANNTAAPPPTNNNSCAIQVRNPIGSFSFSPPAAAANNNSWRSGALLAASLVIGIFIGASTTSALPGQVLSELTALAKGEQLSATWQDVADLGEGELNEFDEEAL